MATDLIIVESPAKARRLSEYLGNRYATAASKGHIRDLPPGRLGVDVEHGFEPEYEVSEDRKKLITELKKAVKAADTVILATDHDREGEAIAWHLAQVLNLKNPPRIVFHEVTRRAVEEALESPRQIDQRLVDAQQARRVVDRLVGYPLSQVLQRHVMKGLGTGRVNSVALRLVCEREQEREAFVPREFWTLHADLLTADGRPFRASYVNPASDAKNKEELPDEASAAAVRDAVQGAPFLIERVESKKRTTAPQFPYTTSSLQQDASSRLRFGPTRTMKVAQELYEGDERGQTLGLITYMRTDSTEVSPEAYAATTAWISQELGAAYAAPSKRKGKSAKLAQEAHEAIRPTDPTLRPRDLPAGLTKDQRELYELIWNRFVASCMAPSVSLVTTAHLEAAGHHFRVSGSVLEFDGYTRIWGRAEDPEQLPLLVAGQNATLVELHSDQHFTKAPARFTEATLIEELEKRGIGRPSTYANTVDKIGQYKYVVQEDRRLAPTRLGRAVDQLLVMHFSDVVNPDFTAELESQLDLVQSGETQWQPPVAAFYKKLELALERSVGPLSGDTGTPCPLCGEGTVKRKASKHGPFLVCSRGKQCGYREDLSGEIREEAAITPTGQTCPKCGRELMTRHGKRGDFIGCAGYPDCDYTAPVGGGERAPAVLLEEICPKCGKHPLARKQGRRGEFVGCSGYPECDFIQGRETSSETAESQGPCPKCGKPLMVRQSRRGPFVGCSGYPECKYIGRSAASSRPAPEPIGEDCPECKKPLVKRSGPRGAFIGCSGYPKCRYSRPVEAPETAPVA